MCRLILGIALLGTLVPLQAEVTDWLPEWKAFRSAYPYHFQAVALSRPNDSGRRLLIISEPPPAVTANDITAIDPVQLKVISIQEQAIGFDGWVKDALVELPALPDDDLTALVDKLHIGLFGTAYKSAAIEIPHSPQIRNTGYALDLRVSASALNRWLLSTEKPSRPRHRTWLWPIVFIILGLFLLWAFARTRHWVYAVALVVLISGIFLLNRKAPAAREIQAAGIGLMPVLGGAAESCEEILGANIGGVFLSSPPGLVVWSVKKSDALDSHRREVREFALDSDLLLGAVGIADSVAIVARERVVPTSILPPLRTETILLLASERDSELQQSYERTFVFAGPFKDVQGELQPGDWAPIYLSPALKDTEYGSLLNITDQLLKSWSMSGKVRYIRFNYPDPASFPFPKPLMLHANTHSLLFNWNTKGAGYSSDLGKADVFAWTRTGALPVDYRGSHDARLQEFEDTGYDFFARSGDPNLARVVQYAELYQIFRHYGIRTSTETGGDDASVPEVFRQEARKLVRAVTAMADRDIRDRLRDYTKDASDEVSSCKSQLDGIAKESGEAGLDALGDALAGLRQYQSLAVTDARITKIAENCQSAGPLLQIVTGVKTDELRRAYVQAVDRRTAGWIRTPSIVISHAEGEVAGAIGGHNLNSNITPIRASKELPAGEIRIAQENGRPITLYSDKDVEKIHEAVRPIARDEGSKRGVVGQKVRAALAAARPDLRPMPQAVAYEQGRTPSTSRGFRPDEAAPYGKPAGFRPDYAPLSDADTRLVTALHSDTLHTIVIERKADGAFVLIDGPTKHIVQARSQPGATDALLAYIGSTGQPVHLHLRGFKPREAQGFARSAELQLATSEVRVKIGATIEDGEVAPERLKGLLAESYAFREVTVKDVSKPYQDSEGRSAIDLGLEARAKSGKTLLIRLKLTLKAGVQWTAAKIAQVTDAILSAFRSGSLQAGTGDTILTTTTLIQHLQAIYPDIDIEGKITKEGEGTDLYIGDHRDLQCDSGKCRQTA